MWEGRKGPGWDKGKLWELSRRQAWRREKLWEASRRPSLGKWKDLGASRMPGLGRGKVWEGSRRMFCTSGRSGRQVEGVGDQQKAQQWQMEGDGHKQNAG